MKRLIFSAVLFAGIALHSTISAPFAHGCYFQSDPFKDMALPPFSVTNAPLATVAEKLEKSYTETATKYDRSPKNIQIIVKPSCTNIIVSMEFNKSIQGCLKELTQVYGIKYTVLDYTNEKIVLTSAADKILVPKIYNVPPTIFQPRIYTEKTDVSSFFRDFGFGFDEDATAVYLPIGKLIVHNTSSDFCDFEKILQVINVQPYQLETTLRLVKVDDQELAENAMQQPADTNLTAEIEACDTVMLMSATAISGQLTSISSSNTDNGKYMSKDKHTGTTHISLVNSVTPDGTICTIALKGTITIPIEKHGSIDYDFDTALLIRPNSTLRLWLTPSDDNSPDLPSYCLLISPRFIDITGEPFPDDDDENHIAEKIAAQSVYDNEDPQEE